jgi:hypothetical protein
MPIGVGFNTLLVASDGEDLWVASNDNGTVARVHASDGRILQTYPGATRAFGVLVARGLIWVTGATSPGSLYQIIPGGVPAAFVVSDGLGPGSEGIATDGRYIWTANPEGNSVSRVDPEAVGVNTTTFLNGFIQPDGIIFDGANLWVTDLGDNTLKKLDPNGMGTVVQSVSVGGAPRFPVFDGSNIWVPNSNDASVSVVRARDGMVLATLTGNGLNGPVQAAFDGVRILVTNFGGGTLSLWNATDLTPIGNVLLPGSTNLNPWGACSDGINFWITMRCCGTLYRL